MKNALLVIDYQKDFVDGALGFPGAEKLEPVIIEHIKKAISNKDEVIFTYDTHEANYLETEEGKNLPVVHCIKGSEGWKLYGKLNEYVKDATVFDKPTFGSLELGNYLKDKEFGVITIVGLVSNICVISNAIIAKAALPNAHIVVDSKATASFDPELNQKTMDVLKGLQIEVI